MSPVDPGRCTAGHRADQRSGRHGFEIRLAPPPRRGAYGIYESKSRRLWVSPLAFQLGIGRQVFIHEATHAVQSCGGAGMRPLGVTATLNPVLEREISRILFNRFCPGNRCSIARLSPFKGNQMQ